MHTLFLTQPQPQNDDKNEALKSSLGGGSSSFSLLLWRCGLLGGGGLLGCCLLGWSSSFRWAFSHASRFCLAEHLFLLYYCGGLARKINMDQNDFK